MKKLILFIILIGLAIGGYIIWTYSTKPKPNLQPMAIKVLTYTVIPNKLAEKLNSVGTLEANESTLIRAEVTGKVSKINFKEGQPTKIGDPILKIDDAIYIEAVNRAQAEFDLATLTFDRNLQLQKTGAVALQAKDEAESSVRTSEADLEMAKIRLAKTEIVAPFDGIIGLSPISIGDYLNIGDPIVNIAAINPLKMQFSLPQKYFSDLKENSSIILTVDALPEKKFEGKIYAINPIIDIETRNISVKALIPNDNHYLRPGMFGYVNLDISENPEALMIPEEAIIPSSEKITVMKVVDGKAKTTKIKLGIRQNGMAEVIEGLQSGDVVISAGNFKVKEGTPIEPISDKMPVAADFENKK